VVAVGRVDDVETLPRHGGVETPLEVLQLLIPLDAIADDDLLDAVGYRFVRGLPAAALGRLVGQVLGLLLLLELRLAHGQRGVLSLLCRSHHGPWAG